VPPEFYPAVRTYVDGRIAEFDQIPEPRKRLLREITDYVRSRLDARQPARLTFICTHNSRRSHLSQIWAAVAADHYGIRDVEVFSGGTEATAFAPQAIAAIERAGLKVSTPPITTPTDASNLRHEVRYQDPGRVLLCFSKVYHDAPNPGRDYCAVMTCTHADANCPVVFGATVRVAVPFEDPKAADGSPNESATYDERCRQIAREMLYAFSQVES
jgi:protein-tyrosine-phosphatase